MGGGADGPPCLLVGLPGRGPDQPLHAEVTSGSLLLSISGPGVEVFPLAARGMRCISQVRLASPCCAHSTTLPRSGPACPACSWRPSQHTRQTHTSPHLPSSIPSPPNPSPYVQRFMVSQVNNNVDLAPVGRVTLVQQLQNCMPLASGPGEAGRGLLACGAAGGRG